MGMAVRLTNAFSTVVIQARRKKSNIFNTLVENKCKSRITYLNHLSLRKKAFSDESRELETSLKGFVMEDSK